MREKGKEREIERERTEKMYAEVKSRYSRREIKGISKQR